jgi:LPS-assembly protein
MALLASTILSVGAPHNALAQSAVTGHVVTTSPALSGDKAPVDFVADNLMHDDENQKIIASGNVELEQSGRIVRADEIIYDLRNDQVVARGNAALTDEEGNVYFADNLDLSNSFKDGFAQKIRVVLAQGDYFWAEDAKRIDGRITKMNNARYTPCKPCEDSTEKSPAWSINAKQVEHNKDDKTISYKNAWFEAFGVPVLYTPYFSHPDGSENQKSGFLAPSLSFDSELGGGLENAYYWGIAPDMDATIGLEVFTQEAPVLHGEFRKRFTDASVSFSGSITDSSRTERSAGNDIEVDDEIRGHLKGVGLWDIDDKWRAGFDAEFASDNQYLNQYNINSEDTLESELYLERFDGRNYAVSRALLFQDLRIDEDIDQPNVVPQLSASFIQKAGGLLGGRLDGEVSMLGLRREGNGQDLNRVSARGAWERRFISGYGLVSDLESYVHGDLYNARDVGFDDETVTEARLYPVVNWRSEFPLARAFDKIQVVVAPIAGVTLAPDLNESSEDDIPNEDSLDVQLDASNLFEASRFPGLDRVEDDMRATYGIRAGVYGYEGSHAELFIGQSYRFDENDNPFASGSGLSDQHSDYVGSVGVDIKSTYNLDYRFQLDGESLKSERHEVSASARWDDFTLSSNYFYARAFQEADADNGDGSREQLSTNLAYYFKPDWRFRIGGRYDLGEDQGLRNADFGLDYLGQCLSLTSTLRRNLTDDASGDSSTEFVFSIGLKNIGEFIEAKK